MGKHFIYMLFLCAVAAVCHAEERWALLVGIDQYAEDMITPLKGAVRDTIALRKALIAYAGFPNDNVICLTSDSPNEVDRPDLGNIVTKLEYIASKMKSDDVFLFFFAGHGITQEGKSYLLTYKSDIRSPLLLAKTGLSVEEELMSSLEKMGKSKIILILDACRNDPGSGRGDVDNLLTDQFARAFRLSRKAADSAEDIELRATIYACKIGERAFEYPGLERGFFSFVLEEALSGKADKDGDKKVTLNEVDSYLSKRVPDLIKRELGGKKLQTPWIDRRGSGAGDWVFSQVSDKLSLDIGIYYEDAQGNLQYINEGSVLHSGDAYALYVRPDDSCYLYIYQIDDSGSSYRLFPNEEYNTGINPLKSGEGRWIPNTRQYLVLDETIGKERLYIFASPHRIIELESSTAFQQADLDRILRTMGVAGLKDKPNPYQVEPPKRVGVAGVEKKLQAQGAFVYGTWFWHR